MEEADALEALGNVLERLTENPYDISLHAEHIRIANATGLDEQAESALDMFTAFWAAGDEIWLPLIDRKLKSANLESEEGLNAVLGLFERAEQDYLSIPLLQRHLEFLIERHEHYSTAEQKPEDLGELFSTEWTRAAISAVVSQGAGHLSRSHQLFDLQRDWVFEQLQNAPDTEKAPLIEHVESMLLGRLQQPHSNHDETFQAYSTFTTNYKPADQYESLLVKASKMKAQAVKTYQRHEPLEHSLTLASYSLEAYAYYLTSERRKKPDLFVLKTLYERAIAEAAKRRFAGEAGAEEALRSFWIGYLDFLRIQDVDDEISMATYNRALRSVPASGEVWARYMRFLERLDSDEVDSEIAGRFSDDVLSAYEKAMSVGPLVTDAEQLVPVVLTRAGFEKRRLQSGDASENGFAAILDILTHGINRVRKASPTGDPRLRLEKFFSAICLDLADQAEHALIMWEDTTKHYKTSYLAWTSYTDVLIKQRMLDDARKVFRDVAMKNLDWPEAIWDAWVTFEQLYGSVEAIEDALDRVERANAQTHARRLKEAERAGRNAMQLAAEQQAASVPVTEAAPPTQAQAPEEPGAAPMDVDAVQRGEARTKRKAEEEIVPDESKKAKLGMYESEGDRENCTVFVADLPSDAQEADLAALFKDCGDIREIKITQLSNARVATVEFHERESVPAALTKDKKRVHDEEVAVHLAWKSTLYVTNFPEKADDAFIRELFGKYGTIFDVRWPSKKFKATRRFCYVQYTSPAAAEAALELHGHELEPGMPLSVLISNPERKQERTDSGANDREVYVAGLSRFATKEDLENLFKTYGAVKDVRMALDNNGRPKGFAFVEFEREEDARAALSANNHELKRRRIAVTLADTHVRSKNRCFLTPHHSDPKAEVRNRSVRIRKLPPGTQEGLLHQALEKIAAVKRVEVFSDKNEADVELESAAEAGKLLLHADPIVFEGSTLEVLPESTGGARTSRPATPPAGGMFVPRTAVSRPRAGLGSKKRVTTIAASSSTAAVPGQASGPQAQAKGQDDFRKMLSGGK
ncbi:RNA-binding protein Prp24 [Obba rivulosa]|uniref:U4/U6 snRNA-associated-splicing factor PRP24 n=1 Tax=Obba rivulosa TaxID=1052685 RepID=A0A8E2B510_9APHY|nr:RNA-binding protein Prp24 [Obba rivulosa]